MALKNCSGVLMIAAAGLSLLSAPAAQATLIGSSISWQYYGGGGPYNPGGGAQTSGSFIADGGVDGTLTLPSVGSPVSVFNIVVDDTSITFDYSVNATTGPWSASILSLSPTISNGIALTLLSGPAITAVTIDNATNMAGFSAFSFTGNQVQVDWANLPFSSSTIVKLNVTTGSSTVTSTVAPEPGTALLLLLPLALFAGVRRFSIR